MNLNTVFYIIVICIIFYLFTNPKVEYVPVEYETVRIDSFEVVTIDTFKVVDTVRVQIDIPEPIKEDSISVYRTSFIDPYLSIYINSRIYGELLSQDLTYSKHYDRITIDKITYVDRYLHPTKPLIGRNNYTSIGVGLTTIASNRQLETIPNIYLQTKGVIYRVGYNPFSGTVEAGINIQIFGK